MVGRLPESWIPPAHLLDLRARVRLRHTLVDARREWQQRMQAVLYHHGVPSRSWLMTAASRAWLAQLELPATAREQITIALAMIDAHDAHLAPLDQRAARLRAPPARLPCADAPLRDRAADVDHDPRRARRRAPLLVLARGRPLLRPGHHRPPIRRPPRRPATSPAKAHRRCAGRSSKPRNARVGPAHPTTPTTPRRPRASAATARAWPSRASCSSAATTPCANSARRPCARMTTGPRAQPSLTPMHRGRLPACSCRHPRVDGLHRPSGRTASRNTPSPIMSPIRSHPGSRTEIRLGVRARTTRTTYHAHAPPLRRLDAEDGHR